MSGQGSSSKGRIRKLTAKAAALVKERDNHEPRQTNPKASRKKSSRKRNAKSDESDSSESDEGAPARKRPRQPNPEEIEVGGESTDDEPEVVHLDSDDVEGSEDEDGNDGNEEREAQDIGAEEDDDVELIDTETDSLQERHLANIPTPRKVKKDSTRDLLLVFSERVTVTFKMKGGSEETKEGRWCEVCRKDPEIKRTKSFQKAFLTGSNMTCRGHIRQHYEYYSKRCKEAGIEESERCVPPDILRARRSKAAILVQTKLTIPDGAEPPPKQFTREGTLRCVTKFIACDDQAFEVANKPSFRNCLTSMRPHTIKADLPSAHDVKVCLLNEFVRHLHELKSIITKLPGKASITVDGWTVDSTRAGFVGMTAHWIRVTKKGDWMLEAQVIALRGLSGDHGGKNLGRYVVGLCDRVGLMGNEASKLYGATLDNTSSNGVICRTVSKIHKRRKLDQWDHKENQFMCLGHVVNLANIDVMSHITKIAAVETKTAIWEYDPGEPSNRISNGGLDVIATIRTLAIKIQASGMRIEKFNELQRQTGIAKPLKIPLHSNVRWGTAFAMLDRSLALRNAITLFVNCADNQFGPITTIRKDGQLIKEIPWTAFTLSDSDWCRVADARDILADSNRVQQCFSSENQATLWRALPLIEDLQTRWEKKRDGQAGFERFSIYQPALQDGLDKLRKYYNKFDEKPAYILALILHPYYKLDYIKLAWGGEKEQDDARDAGDFDAKNWQDEALKIFEQTAELYWKNRSQIMPTRSPLPQTLATQDGDSIISEFDRHRQSLLRKGVSSETWGAEVRRYLNEVEEDVTKDTDIVKWWQKNARIYPTLARIALDVLPCQASSVPCERLFSSSKQVATERRARLGSDRFEQLLIMKSAWRGSIVDWAAANSNVIEEVDLNEYVDLLKADEDAREWEKEDTQFVFESDSDLD